MECDANQIQQVILVLMVNASEAMPKGGHAWRHHGIRCGGEQGVVRVKDTGCGIPPDVLPHIFDPFFTTKEDQNRTGLGLAVAHRHRGAARGRDLGPLHAGRRNGVPGDAAGIRRR